MKTLSAVVALFASNLCLADGFDGFYLGAYGGYAWSKDRGIGYLQATGANSNWTQTTRPSGALYGVLGGYNWTFDNGLLLGLEADFEGHANDSDRDYQAFNGQVFRIYHATTRRKEAGSLRGRAGYLLNDHALVYATAGYAAAKLERIWYSAPFDTAESHSDWQSGWVAGVGGEFLVSANLSLRLEYRYLDYGTKRVPANLWEEYYRQRLTGQALQAGLAYQF